MNGDLHGFDASAPDLATTMRVQSRQLESALLSAMGALDRAVDRLVAELPGAEPAVPGSPTMAAPDLATPARGVNAVLVVNAAAPALVPSAGLPAWEPATTATAVPVGGLPAIVPPAVRVPARAEPTIASQLATPAESPVPGVVGTLRDATEALVESARRSPADVLSPPLPAMPIAEQLTSAIGAPVTSAAMPIPAPSASLSPGVTIEPTLNEGIVTRVAEAAPSPLVAGAATPAAETPAVGASEPLLRAIALPTAGPLVERIMGAREPARGAPAAEGVTITGGVNVQVSAETIDLENAEETARVIASHVLEELDQLIDRDRFRRGLPTAATA